MFPFIKNTGYIMVTFFTQLVLKNTMPFLSVPSQLQEFSVSFILFFKCYSHIGHHQPCVILLCLKNPLSSPSKQDFFIDLIYWPRILYCWIFKDTADDMNLTPHNEQDAATSNITNSCLERHHFKPVKHLHRVGLLHFHVKQRSF